MMEHFPTKKLVKGGTEEVVKALEEQPFVIVIKNKDCLVAPDVQVTIMTADPCDAVVLAARVVDLYKREYGLDPIVELMPFLEVDDDLLCDPNNCPICLGKHDK